jgi:hypothetical protein
VTKGETILAAAAGQGCLGRAFDDEPVFVLRAHDRAAPGTVRDWAERARRMGGAELKVASAMDVAMEMEAWQRKNGFKEPD